MSPLRGAYGPNRISNTLIPIGYAFESQFKIISISILDVRRSKIALTDLTVLLVSFW